MIIKNYEGNDITTVNPMTAPNCEICNGTDFGSKGMVLHKDKHHCFKCASTNIVFTKCKKCNSDVYYKTMTISQNFLCTKCLENDTTIKNNVHENALEKLPEILKEIKKIFGIFSNSDILTEEQFIKLCTYLQANLAYEYWYKIMTGMINVINPDVRILPFFSTLQVGALFDIVDLMIDEGKQTEYLHLIVSCAYNIAEVNIDPEIKHKDILRYYSPNTLTMERIALIWTKGRFTKSPLIPEFILNENCGTCVEQLKIIREDLDNTHHGKLSGEPLLICVGCGIYYHKKCYPNKCNICEKNNCIMLDNWPYLWDVR